MAICKLNLYRSFLDMSTHSREFFFMHPFPELFFDGRMTKYRGLTIKRIAAKTGQPDNDSSPVKAS
ncbi:hypothetical protein DKP76_06805 [Falsochrobactrum shanghaiense]|uniref:Uncharacterized protein n=1 Tax=Falsochrobactrum shanghaiense TaxID=2201899 RepID=A0A316JDN1_9HYPH|nr:hypothetical protein DKP76_06805 [Falsochrobactrum shanghaiense]